MSVRPNAIVHPEKISHTAFPPIVIQISTSSPTAFEENFAGALDVPVHTPVHTPLPPVEQRPSLGEAAVANRGGL